MARTGILQLSARFDLAHAVQKPAEIVGPTSQREAFATESPIPVQPPVKKTVLFVLVL